MSMTHKTSEQSSVVAPYVWKCHCGKFQAKIHHDPLAVFNCHCRSCVTSMRYIQEKYPSGTSASSSISQDSHHGDGVAIALIALSDIEFLDNDPSEKLGYVKVGARGKNVRTFAKCCGTPVTMAGGKGFLASFRPFNRNALYRNADSHGQQGENSPYQPSEEPLNVMSAFALKPENVPEPKCGYANVGLVALFASRILQNMIGLGQNEELRGIKALYCDPTDPDVEVVPIPWE